MKTINFDDIYEKLLVMHRGLSDAESAVLNAKMILQFCQHVDLSVIEQVFNLSFLTIKPGDL